MGKYIFVAEKPSVAMEFAKVLNVSGSAGRGYLESDKYVVTWCVGHLVTMSYPDAYDPRLKKWSLDTLPFLPEEFRYELISGTKKQYDIVSGLLKRSDVERIYVCTDSGREGEYIYRLVDQMAQVGPKDKRRVWIDSQTQEEIERGISQAKPLSAYDNIADSAYLRAKEDYLMGINFSRLLTLKYGQSLASYLHQKYTVVAVGRVMTCVLGMVVRREREIRAFVKTPFYRVMAQLEISTAGDGEDGGGSRTVEAEWRAVPGSVAWEKPVLYKENGFKERADAQKLIAYLKKEEPLSAVVEKKEKKSEKKNAPLLYNLAELQNDCSKMFKLSPDETLNIVQELYEKKLVTYPRTDARVLSSAVAKEIRKNIEGLRQLPPFADIVDEVLQLGSYKKIGSTRYTNDKMITDHYAVIPTGQGLGAVRSLKPVAGRVYFIIVRRFLSIFYPPAEYKKISLTVNMRTESFFAAFRVLETEGYLKVAYMDVFRGSAGQAGADAQGGTLAQKPAGENADDEENDEAGSGEKADAALLAGLDKLRKGSVLPVKDLNIKEGETTPPRRYNSGSMILAMENAGQFIEDEELRSQIKGSGIGTSATRAEILKKLVHIRYLSLNKKTQMITPTQLGEMIYDVVDSSIRSMLNPELTASWEKGLGYVAEGSISADEYMTKLEKYISDRVNSVRGLANSSGLRVKYDAAAKYYSAPASYGNRRPHVRKKAAAKSE